ncbi:DnaJ domain-containing protein, partial [Cardiosporidium cionae]
KQQRSCHPFLLHVVPSSSSPSFSAGDTSMFLQIVRALRGVLHLDIVPICTTFPPLYLQPHTRVSRSRVFALTPLSCTTSIYQESFPRDLSQGLSTILHSKVFFDHPSRYSSSNLRTSSVRRPCSFSTNAKSESGDDSPSSGREAFFRELRQKSPKHKTYYEVLQVKRYDTAETIKKAYIRLAKLYHPDQSKDPNAAEHFREIQEAYTVLGSRWKRPLYDKNIDFGTQTYGNSEDVWNARWDQETEEERAARRERYKRYSTGERTDFPPNQTLSPFSMVIILFSLTAAVVVLIATAPEKMKDPEEDLQYDDKEEESHYKGIPFVKAFFNPLSNRWERLPEGYEAPSPQELLRLYKQNYPHIRFDHIRIPLHSLTVSKIPRSQTTRAVIVMDPQTGKVHFSSQLLIKK